MYIILHYIILYYVFREMPWTSILSSSEPDVVDRYMLMTLRSVSEATLVERKRTPVEGITCNSKSKKSRCLQEILNTKLEMFSLSSSLQPQVTLSNYCLTLYRTAGFVT